MRVLVTGASGFIGRALCAELQARGHEVVRMQRRDDAPGVVLLDLETALAQPGRLDAALEGVDAVAHLAWGFGTNTHRDDPIHFRVNLAFTRLLVDKVLARPGVRLVGTGSQAEYGRPGVVLRPDTPTDPFNAYGAAKLEAGRDLMARLPDRGAWARILTAYGPGDDPNKLIPYLLRQFRAGQVAVLSPGEQVWDWLYVTDAAAALATLLETPTAAGLFVIASEQTRSIGDLALTLHRLAGERGWRAPAPRIGGRPYNANELMLLAGDAARLRHATGWRPRISLDDGLERLFSTPVDGSGRA